MSAPRRSSQQGETHTDNYFYALWALDDDGHTFMGFATSPFTADALAEAMPGKYRIDKLQVRKSWTIETDGKDVTDGYVHGPDGLHHPHLDALTKVASPGVFAGLTSQEQDEVLHHLGQRSHDGPPCSDHPSDVLWCSECF